MYIFENELLVTMAVQQSPHGYGGGVVYFFSRLSSVFDILQTHSECTAPTCTPYLPTSSEHTYFGNFTNIDNPDGGRRLFDPSCSSLMHSKEYCQSVWEAFSYMKLFFKKYNLCCKEVLY